MKTKMKLLLLTFAMLFAIVTVSIAAPPDLTAGGVPNEDPAITINLGPTGARGWVYHDKIDTGESRQILVTTVDSGSPASGILAVNDVILGADGTGANPSNFSSDARKSLGLAIGDAEARSPATLKLLRWRSGNTTTVTLTLQTMGAYTATAPYSCPKSALILQQGLQYVYDHETPGAYSFGGITLLANGNSTYQAKAQTIARALVPSQSTMTQMMSDDRDDTSMIAWERGHVLIFLAEYYLETGDTQVLPAIEAYAVNIAKNTSLYGTTGHGFAQKWPDGSPNGPNGDGYGTVNTPALFCLIGMELALECGLTNPEIDPAIERALRFFSYYSGKGAVPYGDHEPFYQLHENNGKSGTAALAFMFQNDRVEEGKFFSKMCTASATEREYGHSGAFFNYVWQPLGAAVGGEEAAAALFSRLSWAYDLNRCWNGRFQYDCLNGEGPINGSEYNNFRMSTAMLLTYALPERQLRITGKGHDSGRWLSSTDVTEAVAADDYDVTSRSDSELIADLSNWSPKVRYAAGAELGSRSIDSTELSQITALANDTGGDSLTRAGACYALGQIGDSSSSATMAALITDSDRYVRYMAAEAMRYLPQASNLPFLDTILAATASTAEPLFPMVDDDPLHLSHGRLAMLLFYSGGSAYGPKGIIWDSVDGVDRGLLYPAIEAVAYTPIGMARSALYQTYQNLNYTDVLTLSKAIVDSIVDRAPTDRMFSHSVRAGGVAALRQHNIAEGVPAGMIYCADTVWNGDNRREAYNMLGAYGQRLYTVTPDPGAVAFIQSYENDWEIGDRITEILAEIAADTNTTILDAFKSITSATADDNVLTLPSDSTVLRVSGIDFMNGDSIYTWNKILGPGGVTITPNGTSATASTLQFDGTPGTYQFKVTMSDSRGFTEVYETVTVFLRDQGEIDDDPPIPNPASFSAAPAADSETAISMTAVTGADVNPVEYLFSETTGNPGGTSSSWQASPSYTDSGLSPLTQYAYMVTMRDSVGNTGTTSSAVSVTTPGTLPPSDIISVNFYAYGALLSPDYDAVTLEADEAAGFGGWNTAGWENYLVPWAPTSPRPPVTIASAQSTTATLTLNDVRNGGPYVWNAPHALLSGDGNGDLMDGHCNATYDPGDGSNIFDMVVSDITFGTYDVIVYIGSNAAQFGDGTGKYIFNGGSEQDFTLTSGEFTTFAEITNPGTPGNYILFENVTGSSFTLQVWGNGFNHIGPTGFQIASAGTTSDASPPTPNPASFATAPYAISSSAISMTATTGSDASGPVEYLFSCLTAGGHGSGWQTSPSYTDTGLDANTQYTYTVTMRDAVIPVQNVGTVSAGASATTDALPDTDPPTPNPATFAVAPSADSFSAISMTATTGSDASGPVEYLFTETSGNPGGTSSGWQTSASYTDSGLSASTQYTYTVTMRDSVGNTGTASSGASATTDPAPSLPAAPSNLSATAISKTQINLSWTDNATDETGFKIERSDRNNTNFVQIATVGANVTSFSDTGLKKNTTYYYRVRATNGSGDSAYSNEASATTPK